MGRARQWIIFFVGVVALVTYVAMGLDIGFGGASVITIMVGVGSLDFWPAPKRRAPKVQTKTVKDEAMTELSLIDSTSDDVVQWIDGEWKTFSAKHEKRLDTMQDRVKALYHLEDKVFPVREMLTADDIRLMNMDDYSRYRAALLEAAAHGYRKPYTQKESK